MSDQDPLRPARYAPQAERSSFRRGLPWPLLLAVLLFVGGAVGFYRYQQNAAREALRADILRVHQDEVGPVARQIRSFRARVEALAMRAVAGSADTYVREGFTFESLHGQRGLYLRIPAELGADRAGVERAARGMDPDAIGRCFGLAPVTLRTVYERSDFLEASWVRGVLASKDVMRLRVMQNQLRRHVARDLPLLQTLADSDYLLMVVLREQSRVSGPVDVLVYDAKSGALRFRTRTRSTGVLLTGRIGMEGAPRQRVSEEAHTRSGAADCSIVSQARQVVGGGAPSVTSVPAAAPAAGPGDAPVQGADDAQGAEAPAQGAPARGAETPAGAEPAAPVEPVAP